MIYSNLLDVQEGHGRESHILKPHTDKCINRVIEGYEKECFRGSEHIKHDLGVISCRAPIGCSIISNPFDPTLCIALQKCSRF